MDKIKKLQNKIRLKIPTGWRFNKKSAWIGFFLLLLFLFLFRLLFWNEKKVGTSQHREESPFCQSDNECVLYDCTSCGNKFWVKKNIEDNVCDKKSLGIVGCRCDNGQCKRVLGK